MKKFAKISFFIVLVLGTLLISGCGKKVALDAAGFKNKMEAYGFEIVDVTEYITDTTVKTAYIAQKADAYQIEFYVSKSELGAKAGYEQYVANLKAVAGETNKAFTELTKDTYTKYTDKANKYYSVASRIDKTYLYVRAAESYEKEINVILTELGY